MIKKMIATCLCVSALLFGVQTAQAGPVDLEVIIAADVSGSIDDTDFALQRAGIEATFRNATIISAIEAGAIGSIAVTLWDFANNYAVAVDWMLISDAPSSNAFADAVALAARGFSGGNDGQSNLINFALTALNGNAFTGTRSVLDIVSEGAQDIDGCSSNDVSCLAVQTARNAFLAGGGTAINAIWLNDRDFFGLDADDIINAYEYGSTNVIGGPGSFQTFAYDFNSFAPAFQEKLIREIIPTPEPTTMLLLGLGLVGLAGVKRKMHK